MSNANAVALGSKGGKANTPAQLEARRINAAKATAARKAKREQEKGK